MQSATCFNQEYKCSENCDDSKEDLNLNFENMDILEMYNSNHDIDSLFL